MEFFIFFEVEKVEDILEISIGEVEEVQQEVTIKTYFQTGWTIEKVTDEFEASDVPLLFSIEKLAILLQEVTVESLLKEGLDIEAIAAKVEVSGSFVRGIQKKMKI